MTFFRRLTTSLTAQIDELVGGIENHDAQIRAAMDEQRRKLAAARVQLNRIRAREQRLGEQLHELQQSEQLWADRAVRVADGDQEQALTCLQRRRTIQQQIKQLSETRQSYHATADKMSADIERCDQELKGMRQKHELMRARQTNVEAQSSFNEARGTNIDDLETSFERWEIRLAQGEIHFDDIDPVDSLEQTFLDEENRSELQAELDALMQEKNHD